MAGPWERYAKPQDAQAAEAPESDGPWSKYATPAPKAPDLAGAAQSGLEHFGNSASLGYLPQLQALASQVDFRKALEASPDPAHKLMGLALTKLFPDAGAETDAKLRAQGFDIQQDKPTYLSERDANIKRLQQQEKDHPTASTLGSIGGALASAAATSALTPISAASRMGRIAQAASGGALIGAVANPGDVEGEVTGLQLGDRARGALAGGALAGAGQGVVEGLSKAAKSFTDLPQTLRSKAEERAFKASGAMLKDYRAAAGQDRINELGRYMLDNGLIKPGATVDDIAKAAESLKGQHGQAIGDILSKLDASGAAAPSADDIAKAIEAQAEPLKNLKTARPTFNTLQNVAGDIRNLGGQDPASFGLTQEIKDFVNKQVEASGGWKSLSPSEKNLALKDAYRAVKDKLTESAGQAAEAAGDPELLKSYLGNKAGYRNAKELAAIAKDQTLRQNANRFFSPSDYFSGGAGAMVGAATGDDTESKIRNAAIGAALGGVNRLGRRYGTPIVSVGLDKLGAVLAKTPLQAIGEATAPALSAIERSPVAAINAARVLSSPKLERAIESALPRVAEDDKKDRRVAGKRKGYAEGGVVEDPEQKKKPQPDASGIGDLGIETHTDPEKRRQVAASLAKAFKFSHGGRVPYVAGGAVPGKALVPGNSPKNDTVKTYLSPGEIVVPRSEASDPSSAAAFAARQALKAAPLKGEAKWSAQGAAKLGLSADEAAAVMGTRSGKQLLIEASTLRDGHPQLKRIKEALKAKGGR